MGSPNGTWFVIIWYSRLQCIMTESEVWRAQCSPKTPKISAWRDKPEDLRAAYRRHRNRKIYPRFYVQMSWDDATVTNTIHCHGYDNDRLRNPQQNKAIFLRAATILKSCTGMYIILPSNEKPSIVHMLDAGLVTRVDRSCEGYRAFISYLLRMRKTWLILTATTIFGLQFR